MDTSDLREFTLTKHRLLTQLDEDPLNLGLRRTLVTEEQNFWRRYLRRCRIGKSWRRWPRYSVTAIVSTYAAAEFIQTCLSDIRDQATTDSIEILVINAASTQDEWQIVEAIRASDPHIVNILTPERIGIYPAWNLAITMARGRYLITCSTNDRLAPTAFATLAQELDADPSLALAYGDSYVTDLPHQTIDNFIPAAQDAHFLTWDDYDYEVLLKNCGIGPHPMWRRSVHQELGFFDCRYGSVADQDFWLRLGWRYPMKHVAKYTGLFWKTPSGLSQHTGALTEATTIHGKYQALARQHQPAVMQRKS